jgi:TonB-linked SusC/RagA family outer membrane protein
MTRWTLRALVAVTLAAAARAEGQQSAAQPAQPAQPAGQVGTVVGQVVVEGAGTPIVGAQVVVVGTTIGALAGADGRFTIRNVPAGAQQVRAQFIGFAPSVQPVTVTAGQTVTVKLQMKDAPYQISPTVVTALGITRSEKSLGYATTTISSQTLERVPETTLLQSLAGQSAGVQVISASGRPGAGARVTIRGESSFSGNTQPLYVVDGVPISTNTSGPSNALSTGSAGSRGMDIDPETIEEISVLRGAAATALYGSRGANGVIVIKTKQGKVGQPLRFNLTSEGRVDRPILGGYITEWAAGSRGYFCNGRLASQGGWCEPGYPGTNSETRSNWGPHIDSLPQVVLDSMGGALRFRDARADFYRTAPTINSSLRASGSMGELGTYTLGTSYLNQQGINPVAELNRLNLNANVNLSLSRWLQSTTSIQRIRSSNPYGDDSYDGLDRQLVDTPPTTDTRQAWMPDGSPVMFGSNTPHYEWIAQNEYNSELTNRWIASQQFSLRFAPGFALRNNWGLDTYVSEYNRFVNERPWRTAQGLTSGSSQQRKTTESTINNDLQLVMEGRGIGGTGVSVSALLGSNLYMRDRSFVSGTGNDIVIPDYYNLGNFARVSVSADLPTKRRIVGAYSQLTFDYHDWAFLDVTGRQDWSSTLPTNANSYFYPSAALSFVLTDALKWESRWLSYAKVRVSKAKVGNDAPPYSLSTRYVTGTLPKGANNSIQQNGGPSIQFPFRGVTSYTQSTQLGNPELRPESTVEDELGLELRFFNGRAGADISAYRKSSYDQIFSIPSSAVTGYTSITRNAGDLRNKGIEVALRGRPVEIGRFSWDARVNWSKNKSEVLRLAPGVTSIGLAGFAWPEIRIMEGQPYGVIWGYGWKRNCVDPDPCFQGAPAGTKLIGNDGYPIRSDNLGTLGSVMPNWNGSVSSEFRYGPVMLSGLVDVRNGGKIINFQTQYEVSNGRSVITRDRNTWTVEEGINIATGQPNTVRLFKNQDYYPLIYGFDRHENMIEPAGFVKLREVTLSYRIPRGLLRRIGVDDATAFVTGRNLRVWSDFSLGDPEGDVYGGTNAGGQYFRWFSEPQTRSFVTGFRTAF